MDISFFSFTYQANYFYLEYKKNVIIIRIITIWWTDVMTYWFEQYINLSRVILCLEVNYVHLHFLYSYFLRVFCTWIYNIKYSYWIQIIFKKIYLTHRCYHSKSEWTWRVGAMKEDSIFPWSPEQEPHHQMQFRIISGTHLFGAVLPFCEGYSQGILSSTDRAEFWTDEIS